MKPALDQKQLAYLTEFSKFAKSYGLPGSTAKVLGFLLICDPALQTAQSIQQQLLLSAGSISAALNLLVSTGMVQRTKAASSKLYSYEIRPDSFQQAILGRLQSAHMSRRLAEKGLALNSNNIRLIAMRDVFGLIEQELPRIIKKLQS